MDKALDLLIKKTSRYFGVDSQRITAMVVAEGGTAHHILKAVQCSYPEISSVEKALEITGRTYVHALQDFVLAIGEESRFIDFLAARWAPRGVKNDPNDLNKNWPKNVKKFLGIKDHIPSRMDVGPDVPGGGAV